MVRSQRAWPTDNLTIGGHVVLPGVGVWAVRYYRELVPKTRREYDSKRHHGADDVERLPLSVPITHPTGCVNEPCLALGRGKATARIAIIRNNRDSPARVGKVHRPMSRTHNSRRAWASTRHRRLDNPRRTGRRRLACARVLQHRIPGRLSCFRAATLVPAYPFSASPAREVSHRTRPRRLVVARAHASWTWPSRFNSAESTS